MQIHESAEDYLETILRLSKRQGQVRSIDIVNDLGYSKPSVSAEGFITLTPSGAEIAVRIYPRHYLLTPFLRMLGVSEETAAADACKIEHDLSDETFEKITEHALHYMQVEPPDFSR